MSYPWIYANVTKIPKKECRIDAPCISLVHSYRDYLTLHHTLMFQEEDLKTMTPFPHLVLQTSICALGCGGGREAGGSTPSSLIVGLSSVHDNVRLGWLIFFQFQIWLWIFVIRLWTSPTGSCGGGEPVSHRFGGDAAPRGSDGGEIHWWWWPS